MQINSNSGDNDTNRNINPNSNRKNKPLSNETRQILIKKITEEGYNLKEAAFLCNINYTTAFSIYRVYKEEGRTLKKKTGRVVNKKITERIKILIEAVIEQQPTISLNEIKEKILLEENINISIESVRKQIRSLGITLKK